MSFGQDPGFTDWGTDWGPDASGGAAATIQAEAQKRAAEQSAQAQIESSKMQADASKYGARMQYQAAQLPVQLKRDIFGQVFPWAQGLVGNALGPGTGGGGGGFNPPSFSPSGGPAGGDVWASPELPKYTPPQLATAPTIDPSSGPVVSPSLLASQINAARATNDQSTAAQIQQQQGSLAGRGVGASSPLGQAIAAQLQGSNIGANAQATLGAQQNAAKLNADYAQAINQANIGATGTTNAAQIAANASAYNAGLGAVVNEDEARRQQYGQLYGTNAQAWQAWQQAQASTRNQLIQSLLGVVSV